MENKKIGFIGTGVMGSSIVKHLLKAGYEVHIYNRSTSNKDELVGLGAIWENSPKEIGKVSDIVMTMVGFPYDVEDVYLNEEYGLLKNHKDGAIFIDLTTSSPTLATKIYELAKKENVEVIDAPVSGGDVGAKNGTLTIMCGGDKETFDKCTPLLEIFGKNVILQGGAGCGQHTKMCNQLAIAPGMLGVCEALFYANKSGLSPNLVLQSIEGGAAGSWSLSNYGPRILKDDFEPGFFIKHFIKDLKIAIDEAEKMNLDLPGAKLAKELYEVLQSDGLGEKGTQALYLWYEGQNK